MIYQYFAIYFVRKIYTITDYYKAEYIGWQLGVLICDENIRDINQTLFYTIKISLYMKNVTFVIQSHILNMYKVEK